MPMRIYPNIFRSPTVPTRKFNYTTMLIISTGMLFCVRFRLVSLSIFKSVEQLKSLDQPLCQRGSFRTSSGCQLCPPGTFSNSFNMQSCLPCPPGTFFELTGAQRSAACRPCPPGTFSAGGAATCTPCPPGLTSLESFSNCTFCPPGTKVNSIGFLSGIKLPDVSPSSKFAQNCLPCDPGTYSNMSNALSCTRCPMEQSIGPTAARSVDQCQACPPGELSFFQSNNDEPSESICIPCGTNGQTGSNCFECPLRFFSPPQPIRSISDCKMCPAGSFGKLICQYPEIVAGCDTCPKGFISFSEGQTFCRKIDAPCPTGYVETTTGDCLRCEVNEFYDPNTTSCKPCPEGTGSDGGLVLRCSDCRDVVNARIPNPECSNFLISKFNAMGIEPADKNGDCSPGTFVLEKGICGICGEGTFSNITNAQTCTPCPPETILPILSRATYCKSCPPGSIVDANRCIVPQTDCPYGSSLTQIDSGSGLNDVCLRDNCPSSIPLEDRDQTGELCTSCRFNRDFKKGIVNASAGVCDVCPGEQVRVLNENQCGCRGNLAINVGIIDGKCEKCPPGSYGDNENDWEDNVCVKCPAGTFRVPVSDDDLINCAAGGSCFQTPIFCKRISSLCNGCLNVCKNCAAGFFTDEDGSTECKPCPPGTFTYGIGDTKCLFLNGTSESGPFDTPIPTLPDS